MSLDADERVMRATEGAARGGAEPTHPAADALPPPPTAPSETPLNPACQSHVMPPDWLPDLVDRSIINGQSLHDFVAECRQRLGIPAAPLCPTCGRLRRPRSGLAIQLDLVCDCAGADR